MRRLLALGVLVPLLFLTGCTEGERTIVAMHNELRAAHGLPPLAWDIGAYPKARSWSKHMADEQRLEHSQLREGVPPGWTLIGENVGVAETVEDAARSLEESPSHRANILHVEFTRVAIGVEERDGVVWVTEIFLR